LAQTLNNFKQFTVSVAEMVNVLLLFAELQARSSATTTGHSTMNQSLSATWLCKWRQNQFCPNGRFVNLSLLM